MRESLIKRLKQLEQVTEHGASIHIVNESGTMTDAEIATECERIETAERGKGFSPLIIIFDDGKEN